MLHFFYCIILILYIYSSLNQNIFNMDVPRADKFLQKKKKEVEK